MAEAYAQREQVEQALLELPLDYRTPLILYTVYEFSVREIAGMLSIREGAVKTRLYRAREMARRALKGE